MRNTEVTAARAVIRSAVVVGDIRDINEYRILGPIRSFEIEVSHETTDVVLVPVGLLADVANIRIDIEAHIEILQIVGGDILELIVNDDEVLGKTLGKGIRSLRDPDPQRAMRTILWIIIEPERISKKGEVDASPAATSPVTGSCISRPRRKTRATVSVANAALTHHGRPISTPRARSMGHPGGYLPKRRFW